MHNRRLSPEMFDIKDAKLRIFIAIKNSYNHFITKNRSPNANLLSSAINIDLSHETAVEEFLAKSQNEINKALIEISPLYISNRGDIDNILQDELSILTFTYTKNIYIQSNLPRILGYDKSNYKIDLKVNPQLDKTESIISNQTHANALLQLNDILAHITSELESEITNLINSIQQGNDRLTQADTLLIGQYKETLLVQASSMLSIAQKECLSCIFHLENIDFTDIKMSIKLSLGLTDPESTFEPLNNFIASRITMNQLVKQINDSGANQQGGSNHDPIELEIFIKTDDKQRHLEVLNEVISKLNETLTQVNQMQKIRETLAKLCEIEAKIFKEKDVFIHDGYFYYLRDNLNHISPSELAYSAYNLLLATKLEIDNPTLTKLINIHADLLKLQSKTNKIHTTIFEIDGLDFDDEADSQHFLDANISSQEIQKRTDLVFQLYTELISGNTILDSDLPNQNYQVNHATEFHQNTVYTNHVSHEINNNSFDDVSDDDLDKKPLEDTNQFLRDEVKLRTEEAKLHADNDELHQANIRLTTLNDKLSLRNTQLEMERAKFEKDIVSSEQSNARLQQEITSLQHDNNQIKKDNSILQEKNKNSLATNQKIQQMNTWLLRDKSQLKKETRKLEQDKLLLQLSNDKDSIINNFSLFYKAYRNHATKGFCGMFTTHGNTGRDVAKRFKILFYRKLNEMKIDFSKSFKYIVRDIQIAFKSLIQEQNLLLASGNYAPYSFKTYLLAYNDYLDSIIQNDPISAQNNILKNFHANTYVLNKNINIEKTYMNSFELKSYQHKPSEYLAQYGKR